MGDKFSNFSIAQSRTDFVGPSNIASGQFSSHSGVTLRSLWGQSWANIAAGQLSIDFVNNYLIEKCHVQKLPFRPFSQED